MSSVHVAERDADADLDLFVGSGRDLAAADVAHGARQLAAAAGVADAHAAAGLRREAGRLGLVEQRAAAVGGLDAAAREAQRAGRGVGVVRDGRVRRRDEALDVQPLLQPRRAHCPWTASTSAVGPQTNVSAASGSIPAASTWSGVVAVELAAAEVADAREAAQQAHVAVPLGEPAQLLGVGDVALAAGVVDEGDRAVVALVAERSQHRHQRRDAAAAADQQQLARASRRQREVALRLREADDVAGQQARAQVGREESVGPRVGGQLDQPVVVLGVGRRVRAGVADAVDRGAQQHVLAGAEAAPVVVRAQRQRDGGRRAALDRDDLGAHVAQREGRLDELDVAVDAMWRGERTRQRGAEQATADPSAGGCRRFGEHLCTE